MKKKYQCEGLEGKNFTRTTERTYTHAVVRYYFGKPNKAMSFCGSFDLAQKSKAQNSNYYNKVLNDKDTTFEVVKVVEV